MPIAVKIQDSFLPLTPNPVQKMTHHPCTVLYLEKEEYEFLLGRERPMRSNNRHVRAPINTNALPNKDNISL
jgi:hypothetical protein